MKKHLLALLLVTGSVNGAEFTPKQIVAITILAEARGEGELGMYSVASVIQQRQIDKGLSADKVCLQPYQFSCWNKNDPQNKRLSNLLRIPQANYALVLADKALRNKLDVGVVNYANHYHTADITPSWSKNRKPVKVIGNHKFYRI